MSSQAFDNLAYRVGHRGDRPALIDATLVVRRGRHAQFLLLYGRRVPGQATARQALVTRGQFHHHHRSGRVYRPGGPGRRPVDRGEQRTARHSGPGCGGPRELEDWFLAQVVALKLLCLERDGIPASFAWPIVETTMQPMLDGLTLDTWDSITWDLIKGRIRATLEWTTMAANDEIIRLILDLGGSERTPRPSSSDSRTWDRPPSRPGRVTTSWSPPPGPTRSPLAGWTRSSTSPSGRPWRRPRPGATFPPDPRRDGRGDRPDQHRLDGHRRRQDGRGPRADGPVFRLPGLHVCPVQRRRRWYPALGASATTSTRWRWRPAKRRTGRPALAGIHRVRGTCSPPMISGFNSLWQSMSGGDCVKKTKERLKEIKAEIDKVHDAFAKMTVATTDYEKQAAEAMKIELERRPTAARAAEAVAPRDRRGRGQALPDAGRGQVDQDRPGDRDRGMTRPRRGKPSIPGSTIRSRTSSPRSGTGTAAC